MGHYAFKATVSGGTAAEGLFLDSGGVQSALALAGAGAPGTGGGTYASFTTFHLNDVGDVVFMAEISGGTATSGVFVHSAGGDQAIALSGDTAPETGGGTYTDFHLMFLPASRINDSGEVVFRAEIAGATATNGIFVTESPAVKVPVLTLGGAVALTLLLLVAVATRRHGTVHP